MQDRLFICNYLEQFFDEVTPLGFYRSIFPVGSLEKKGQQRTGEYNALAVELLPPLESKERRSNAKKYIITDDLEMLSKLLKSENFVIISPISYIGKSRQSQNARFIYAMAIDLDGVTQLHNLQDLLYQIEEEYLPRPTYLVWSGTGLHLYYQFEVPLPCFKNITNQLAELKKALTLRIWNGYVSEQAEKPQIESIFQGFRMVGGVTKGGNRTRAFSLGKKVTIEYLNNYVPEQSRVVSYRYQSRLTLKQAAEKYPEWYNRRIVNKRRRSTWVTSRAVYDWWLNELKQKIVVGHRYYGVMVLAVYAKKCGVSEKELEDDAFGLVSMLDKMTTEEQNHFTREDILAALEMYNDNYITFPINSISKLTAVHIEKNKRNGRKQEVHLARARAVQNIDYPNGEWRYHGGRPKGSKQQEAIKQWRQNNPKGTIKQCTKQIGVSKSTVYKYWKEDV